MPRIFLFLLLAVIAARAAESPRKLTYAKGSILYVANLDGSSAKKVANGASPDLSPDGAKLAFHTGDTTAKESYIAIADVATATAAVVPNVPGKMARGPVWSPDGKQLLFQIYADDDWHIAVIGADGSGFRYVKRAEPDHRSYYSIAWAPDGRGFYCQDLDTIYLLGLNGALQDQWQTARLFPHGAMTKDSRIAVSPNDSALLVDVQMNEEVTRKNWDELPPAIWSLNLVNGRATRVTPKNAFAWKPCWITSETFLCLIQTEAATEPSIYRMSADGKARQALIKNARDPGVTR
jgi:TolB protein